MSHYMFKGLSCIFVASCKITHSGFSPKAKIFRQFFRLAENYSARRLLTAALDCSLKDAPRSTQPCIPPGSLNRVPASTVVIKGGKVNAVGWQVTLRDHIWHVISRSGVVKFINPLKGSGIGWLHFEVFSAIQV